jgi:hypothetical protein
MIAELIRPGPRGNRASLMPLVGWSRGNFEFLTAKELRN